MRANVLLIFSLILAVITALAWNYGWSRAAQAEGDGVTAVSAGGSHTCAVMIDGVVKCWGGNGGGQLGDGTRTSRNTPTEVCATAACTAPLTDITAVSAGLGRTCAVTMAGGVKCWGLNYDGALGDGTETHHQTPVDVCADTSCAAAFVGAESVSVGWRHTCAVTTSGGVKCWGRNFFGQLGDGTSGSANDRTTPVDVCADAICTAPLTGITLVSASVTHTCASTAAGTVKCWGRNDAGQLGNGTDANSTTPVDVCADATCAGPLTGVAMISPRGGTCVLIAAGGVKCWGGGGGGELGDGTTTSVRTPVDVCGDASCAAPLAGVAAVSGGSSSCAVTTAGGVKCWGRNEGGELGTGTSTGPEVCPDNVPCSTTPVDACTDASCATPLSGIAAVSTGSDHACAVTTQSGVKCWGSNSWGQLGAGTSDLDPHPPVDVVGLGGKPPKRPHPGDTDGDGCSDQQENGPDPAFGGQREYLNFWDFFDVWTGSPPVRDGTVTVGDIGGVVARFGAMRKPAPTKGGALTEALTPPPPPPAYHPAFDRGSPLPGQNVWNLQPPDGAITAEDIAAVVAQFGHTCVEA